MTLVKLNQKAVANALDRVPYFNGFFNDLMEDFISTNYARNTVPAVNISETDNGFRIELAAPGLKKEDFKINVDNNVLSISAEVKRESEQKGTSYSRKEFVYNSFKRSFNLPEQVTQNDITASYENGLLTISLPKVEAAKPKPATEIKVA
ncbi:MAG: Hsp20/alpha crystallin family protein [Bacteroidetes bacterium]|nr:Hsp20/alpha crystallin family protein [Bacteroidota bacterium]